MASTQIDDIRYEIANVQHRGGIFKLFETVFIPNEPVAWALNQKWDDCKKDWENAVDGCLRDGYTHVAVNSSNHVIGFRLSRIMDMTKYSPGDTVYEWVPAGIPKTLIDRGAAKWSEPEVLGKSKKCMQYMGLCVHPDYSNRGIAFGMCQENLALAKRQGCDACMATASNCASQRVFEKLGFVTVETVPYKDFCDGNGKQYLVMKDPKQTCFKFYVLKL